MCVWEREREKESVHAEMDMVTWVQILNKTVYISHTDNTFGKGLNQVMGKIVEQSELFNIGGNQSRRKKILNSNLLNAP